MLRVLALVLAVALLSSACSDAAGGADDGVAAVASVYPLAWLAQAVAPDASVDYLAAAGQDPHDLELSPQQRAAVEQTDVVLYLGAIDFQPQVEAAVADRTGPVIDAAATLGADALRTVEPHGHDGEAAAGTAVDAHLWFDPELMAGLAAATADAFAEADPTSAATYRSNAEEVADELTALDDQIAQLLRDCRHDEVIVSHEAYEYLLAPHGLTQHGISSAAGHAGASPGDITELVDEIRQEQIPAVLSEPVEGRNDAETVAREAGVELIDILSLDIVDTQQAAAGFPALLLEQAEAVARAAECAAA